MTIAVNTHGPHISLITIDNPTKANAMSRAMLAELAEIWLRFTFGLPEVKWAIYPFGGAASKLVHQIGYVHAMALLLTAETIDADEAARIGLVNEVVPADELMNRAIATAQVIAANSPKAVQAVKRFVSAGFAEHAQHREPLEQELGDAVRASPDFAEGVAAFRERRQPRYE